MVTEFDFLIVDLNAPVTIIEYASLSCSHCSDFHIDTLPKLKKEFVDGLRLVHNRYCSYQHFRKDF